MNLSFEPKFPYSDEVEEELPYFLEETDFLEEPELPAEGTEDNQNNSDYEAELAATIQENMDFDEIEQHLAPEEEDLSFLRMRPLSEEAA